MTKIIHDILTDTYTEIELTKEEVAIRQAKQTEHLADQAAKNADQAAKDLAKQSVLNKLGLTAEEVATLLA